ncbi:MAG: hypothetical protein H7293_20045 [Candidatus Saccharibacteria bacterium]|nr:hypothetical protein [Rhodoferax sp.]
MLNPNPLARALHRLGAFTVPVVLDAAAEAQKQKILDDATAEAATSFETTSMRMLVAASVQEWCATGADDLMEGETMADRLFGMMVGIADDNKDGEITPDEEALITVAMEAAADYMIGKGADEADVLALLNDGDEAAAGRVMELVKGTLPEGDDGSMDDVDSFAFDSESSESVMDAVFDAVYKKKIVIRGGRKMRINKRISGHVRLNSAQKVAIRKAGRKSHSAVAKMRRMKSMRIRSRSGL